MIRQKRPDRKNLSGLPAFFGTVKNNRTMKKILSEFQYSIQGCFRCLIGRSGLSCVADHV